MNNFIIVIFNNFIKISPLIILIISGYILKKISKIDEKYVHTNSWLIFHIFLPILVFEKISKFNIKVFINYNIIIISLFTVFIILVFGIIFLRILKFNENQKGVFLQGIIRSNVAILGITIAFSFYGDKAIIAGGIIIALLVPVYNIISVIALSDKITTENLKQALTNIITNPLILSIILGLINSYFKFKFPDMISNTITLFSQLTIPLALIGIGAFFKFSKLKEYFFYLNVVMIFKIILNPLIAFFIIYFFIKDFNVFNKVTILLLGAPTAISSFIMTNAYKRDSLFASYIVVYTTICYMFFSPILVSILNFF